MNAHVQPSKICGEISAPPSKSYAHRILIAAYLTGKKVTVRNAGASKDVLATARALQSLGAEINTQGGTITVERKTIPLATTVNCDESGSTLRFLLPIAAALGVRASFTGQGRLLSRPIEDLVEALNVNGANIDGLTVKGRLRPGEYWIPANISSQYVTGLLFALPLLPGDSTIVLVGPSVSRGYVDITLDVLCRFGIRIEKTASGYYVYGNQKYKALREVSVEGDYSGAAFPLALAAICGKAQVKGLASSSLQGDAEIVHVLQMFGARVTMRNDHVSVEKSALNAITLDCENIPDLVQIISVVAAYAQGVTTLKNVNRLRMKESDRIEAVIEQLRAAGVQCQFDNGNLTIHGGKPHSATFQGGNDHRTVMSATVLALGAQGASTVVGCEPVNKSYTEFFNDIIKLGGQINVDV